jgi:UDP-N-acetylmuramoyl-tripeptide--D-alanyl-D-alanine ligase
MKTFLLANIAAMYGPGSAGRVVSIYRKSNGPFSYLAKYWNTQDFAIYSVDKTKRYRYVRFLLSFGMFAQIAAGLSLLYAAYAYGTAGSGYIGAATLLSYPIVWAQVLFLLALAWRLLHLKTYGKGVICLMLERQVRQLRERNDFTVIAVVGSVGKTSTKLAVAQLLEKSKRVRYQQGNYNDRLTVPLVLFNVTEPNIYNLVAWAKIYASNRKKLKQPYPYDVAVLELGTDYPGQIEQFAYLRPDLTVVTSVADEHMEYFKTIDAVAEEELSVFNYSTQVLVNVDDVDAKYLKNLSYVSYGLSDGAQYAVKLAGKPTSDGQKITMTLQDRKITVMSRYYGTQGAKIVLAAAAITHMVEVASSDIKAGVAELQPFSGRMQTLSGISDTTLLDDTYNASPLAVRAALDVLGSIDAPQHVAILGSMNELGATSEDSHMQVGAYCDPSKVDLVVTIGSEARKFLAPAAKEKGCTVESFDSPKEAGEFVKQQLKKRAVILAKGSQNRVFAEEALKPLLTDATDAQKLVRQSEYWMRIKRSQFGD